MIPTVEVIHCSHTSGEIVTCVSDFLRRIGKKPIVCKELPGFVINRLQFVLLNEALFLLENGYATKEDIDTAVRWALAPRLALWGPLRTDDLVSVKP